MCCGPKWNSRSTVRQRLIAARNDFARQKLALARTVGLPLAQDFTPDGENSLRALNQLRWKWRRRKTLKGAQAAIEQLSRGFAQRNRWLQAAPEQITFPPSPIYADYGGIGAKRKPTKQDAPATCAALRCTRFPPADQLTKMHRRQGRTESRPAEGRSHKSAEDRTGPSATACSDLPAARRSRFQWRRWAMWSGRANLTQARDRFASGATRTT